MHLHSPKKQKFLAPRAIADAECIPVQVWGPSSEKPELGLAASIEGLRQVRLTPSFCLTNREEH